MKFNKITLIITGTAFFSLITHSSLAAQSTNINVTIDGATQTSKTVITTTNPKSKNIVKNKKSVKSTDNNYVTKSDAKKITAHTVPSKNTKYKLAAINNSVKADQHLRSTPSSLPMTPSSNKKLRNYETTIATKTKSAVTQESPAKFSGSVGLTMGNQSNIDPDKLNKFEGTFFQVDPTLNFTNEAWSGTFGATIRDYADQANSDLFRQNEAKAQVAFAPKISDITTSTTTLKVLHHDERWPDYVNHGMDYQKDGENFSMPLRWTEITLEQKLSFLTGALNTEVGGSASNRNYHNLHTDYAEDVLEPRIYERDYNEMKGFAKVAVQAASFLELAVRPSITHIKYKERQGRQPNGEPGGMLLEAPAYELLTSEMGFDVGFKFAGSTVTPTAMIGQVSDEALGAEDREFYGFGLSSTLLLDQKSQLKIIPSVMYRKDNYDNYTRFVEPAGAARVDEEVTASITASINLAKNFGLNINYSVITEESNRKIDTSENYTDEIVSSGMVFSF